MKIYVVHFEYHGGSAPNEFDRIAYAGIDKEVAILIIEECRGDNRERILHRPTLLTTLSVWEDGRCIEELQLYPNDKLDAEWISKIP